VSWEIITNNCGNNESNLILINKYITLKYIIKNHTRIPYVLTSQILQPYIIIRYIYYDIITQIMNKSAGLTL